MSEQTVRALAYNFQDVGKHLKSTKKRYTYKFLLEKVNHELNVEASSISGKIKIILDGRIVINGELVAGNPFEHSFVFEGHQLQVDQSADGFEFRINKTNFTNLLCQEKNRNQFKIHQEQVQDIKVNQNITQKSEKKINLNIAAIGDGMKKKKHLESDNWNAVGGQDLYVGDQNGNSNLQQVLVKQDIPSMSHQQYSTMQNLFSTVCPTKQIQKQSPLNLLNEFNTMQNMFATQQKMPLPSQLASNPSQFNTMQAMFATQSPKQTETQNFNTIQQLFGTINQQPNGMTPPTPQQFSTMRNMFATGMIPPPNPINTKVEICDPNNFNTIQNLFSTSVPLPTQPSEASLTQPLTQPNQTVPNLQNFSTMQHLFATNNMNISPEVLSKMSSNPTPEQFSTMQNMFATMKLSSQTPTFPAPTLGDKALTQHNSNTIKNEEFSTIQNLFKTGSYALGSQNVQIQ